MIEIASVLGCLRNRLICTFVYFNINFELLPSLRGCFMFLPPVIEICTRHSKPRGPWRGNASCGVMCIKSDPPPKYPLQSTTSDQRLRRNPQECFAKIVSIVLFEQCCIYIVSVRKRCKRLGIRAPCIKNKYHLDVKLKKPLSLIGACKLSI